MSEKIACELRVGGTVPFGIDEALAAAGMPVRLEDAAKEPDGTAKFMFPVGIDDVRSLVSLLASSGACFDFTLSDGSSEERGSYRVRPGWANGFFITHQAGDETVVDYESAGLTPPWVPEGESPPRDFGALLDSLRSAFPLPPLSVGWILIGPETPEQKAERRSHDSARAAAWAEEERREAEERLARWSGDFVTIVDEDDPSDDTAANVVATLSHDGHDYRVTFFHRQSTEDDIEDWAIAGEVDVKVFVDGELTREVKDPAEVYEVSGEAVGESIWEEAWKHAFAFLTEAACGRPMYYDDDDAPPYRHTVKSRYNSDETIVWDELKRRIVIDGDGEHDS